MRVSFDITGKSCQRIALGDRARVGVERDLVALHRPVAGDLGDGERRAGLGGHGDLERALQTGGHAAVQRVLDGDLAPVAHRHGSAASAGVDSFTASTTVANRSPA